MPTTNPLVGDYLVELDRATTGMPPHQRESLREEIAAHLDELIPADCSEAEARALLRQFGSPSDVIGQSGSDAERALPRASRILLWVSAGLAAVVLLSRTLTSGFSVDLSVGAVIPFALAVLPTVPRPGRRRALVAVILLVLDVALRTTLLLTVDGFSGLPLAFMSVPQELAMECTSIVLIAIALIIDWRNGHGRAKRAGRRFA